MKVTVIVVSWNTRDILRECLGLIKSAAGNLDFEAIVVDNGSIDDSASMVSSFFPNMRLLKNNENLGFAKAVNQGILASQSEYVALINSDIMAGERSLEYLVGYMEKNKKLAIVSPQLINRAGKLEDNRGYKPSPLSVWKQIVHKLTQRFYSAMHINNRKRKKAWPSDWLGASYMVIRRKTIEDVGMFHEGIFMYSEDLDFCLRCKDRGWGIEVIPWVSSIHYGGGSSNDIYNVNLLGLVGTYRIAAERLSRLNYFLFGIMWTAVLVLTSFKVIIPVISSSKNEKRKYHAETRKVLRTAIKLSIRPRQYAYKYFSELENGFRKILDDKSMNRNFRDNE